MQTQIRRSLKLAPLFLSLLMATHGAVAQLAHEPFNYAAGGAPGNGGTGWAAAWSPGSSQVIAPGLTYAGVAPAPSANALGPSGTFASRQLQTPVTGAAGTSLILRALMRSDGNGTPATQATLGNFPGGSGKTFIIGDLPMMDANAGNWGLQNDCGRFYSNVPVVANQTVYLVAQIDFNVSGTSDRMRLWVQTTPPAAAYFTLTPDVDVMCDVTTFGGVFWQTQQGQAVDEIRIDTSQTACAQPPNTTMVGWYPFDEPSGITAANLATGNTGRLFNSPTQVTGMVSRALRFDGINDYVQAPSTIVTNFGPAPWPVPANCNSGSYSTCRGDFSIDAWLKVDPGAAGTIIVVDKRSGSPPAIKGYSLFVNPPNRLGLQLADGIGTGFTNYLSPFLSPSLTDGQWHHVAVTVQRRAGSGNGVIRWYHNGAAALPASATNRFGSLANNSPLRIGTRTTASPFTGWFKGEIDELEIFNRVLTGVEVADLYNAGPFGKCK